MPWTKNEIVFPSELEATPIEIIHDGSILNKDLFEGRMIPVLFFDKNKRPDIDEIVRIHTSIKSGDVNSIWEKPRLGYDRCSLIIIFEKPTRLYARFIFKPSVQYVLIYLILKNKAVYLVPGVPGDNMLCGVPGDFHDAL